MIPCIIFEDEHLLVVNKPAGLNTHAPGPFAGEGIYDWLRHREPRWAKLAIIHRLDKETSGVMAFSKTDLANRSLTGQFAQRTVHKKYVLLTDQPPRRPELKVVSALVRVGDKYVSRPAHAGGELAETRFRMVGREPDGSIRVEAEPVTGRTHQVRAHATANGFPILGDSLYGGSAAGRVCLHAQELALRHPTTGEEIVFAAPVDFSGDVRRSLRSGLIDPAETTACRWTHGAPDGWAGWQVDRLGEFLLSQTQKPLTSEQSNFLADLLRADALRGAYHKMLPVQMRDVPPTETSPQRILDDAAPERFDVLENGIQFELSFKEGGSVGLFLDQRDNRRRFLVNHVGAGFPVCGGGLNGAAMLNLFAYTCGFSVCAAKAGARTTSVDLSKKYLNWGKRNFALNGLDPGAHDFLGGDAFDWLRRLAKKDRTFDVVALDPPTFSRSKTHGVFRAEKDYAALVTVTLPLVKRGGTLFASANAANLSPQKFLANVEQAVRSGGRKILLQHYVPQPADFPISREEPAYLKTVWLRVD